LLEARLWDIQRFKGESGPVVGKEHGVGAVPVAGGEPVQQTV